MVGDDEVDHSLAKALPELIAIFAAANGRGAFEKRCPSRNCLCGKVQIVRTRFDGYRKAFGAGGAQFGESARGGEMDDVQAEAKLAAEREKHSDGGELGFFGARLKISFVEGPVSAREICCGGIDRRG